MRDLFSWKNTYGGKILAACFIGILSLSALPLLAGDGRYDVLPDGNIPFEITEPGAYVLVSNVKMTADVTCILLKTSNVDLDLGGHTIEGTGSGDEAHGIAIEKMTPPLHGNIQIHNGTIMNFGGMGIVVGPASHVHEISVLSNKLAGINTAEDCIVENCRAIENNALGQYAGMVIGENSIVRNNIANNNSTALADNYKKACGIWVGHNCRVTGNTASQNESPNSSQGKGFGILIGNNCLVEGNTCIGNKAKGDAYGIGSISLPRNQCTVRNNTCSTNDSEGGSGAGIRVGSHCIVTGNACCENDGNISGSGIRTSFGSIIRKNTCSGNSGVSAYGILSGNNCLIDGNTCHSNQGESSACGIQTSSYSYILNNVCYYQNAKNTLVAGIKAGAGNRVKENVVSSSYSLPDSTAEVFGIYTSATNVDIIGNKCCWNNSTGSGKSAGIRFDNTSSAGNGCVIEGNVCEANKHYGIWVNGSGSRIISNRTCKNGINSFKIDGTGNYYAANIYQNSEPIFVFLGNTSGSTPAPNVGF